MPYKIMMSIAAIVPLIFLIAFAVVPQFFILQAYPGAEGLGLEIGVTQRYIMAGMLFILVIPQDFQWPSSHNITGVFEYK